MDHRTALQPILLALFIGLLSMDAHAVFRVDARGVGTVRWDQARALLAQLAAPPEADTLIGAWRRRFQMLISDDTGSAAFDLLTAGLSRGQSRYAVLQQAKAELTKEMAEANEKDDLPAFDTAKAHLATVNEKLTREQAVLDAQRAAGGVPATIVQMGADLATERPWGPEVASDAPPRVRAEARHIALGNWALAVRAAGLGHGVDQRLQAVATGGGTQSDSNLGFAVPVEVAPGIEREMFEGGEILSRVDVRTITGNTIAYNLIDQASRADGSRQGGVLGYWVDEGTAPTASNLKLTKMELKLRKVGALGVMTDEILEDAAALGGELETAFAEELRFQTENKIYRGNGSAAPLGFLNAPCLVTVSKETGQTAATINTTNLSKMWARLPASSKKNAVWLINVDCEPQLDELTLPAGTAGLQPRFVNYGPDGVLTIKGRPVIPVEYAETVGTVGDIALVDLKRYRLIRKAGGLKQASSMHVYFAQGEQAFRAFDRVDGQAVPRAAITPFKGSNTLSPFVVLATRS